MISAPPGIRKEGLAWSLRGSARRLPSPACRPPPAGRSPTPAPAAFLRAACCRSVTHCPGSPGTPGLVPGPQPLVFLFGNSSAASTPTIQTPPWSPVGGWEGRQGKPGDKRLFCKARRSEGRGPTGFREDGCVLPCPQFKNPQIPERLTYRMAEPGLKGHRTELQSLFILPTVDASRFCCGKCTSLSTRCCPRSPTEAT